MELWIRSQDENNLIKVYDIWIDDTDKVDKGYVSIMANSNFSFELGTYEKKARALEVLDEIQEYINNNCEFIERKTHTKAGTYTDKIETYVYEMPQE